MNDPQVRAAALCLASCQVPKPPFDGSISNNQCAPETIRTAKGRFPADLNKLRGQISLEASVGEPVVLVLECDSSVLLIAACDERNFYGTWDATHAQWIPSKAEDLYGSAFSALVQSQLNGAVGTTDVWVASFLAFPATVQQANETTTAAPAATSADTQPATATPSAPATTTKKKVVRKRPLATPTVTAAATATSEEEPSKKAATLVSLNQAAAPVDADIDL